MTATDIFFHTVLFFNEQTFIFIFLITGYFLYDRKVFSYVIILTLFTSIVNSYLKSIWQIPLNPASPYVWAYPSGHTQIHIVMWLSLILLTRKFKLLLMLIPFFITCYFGMTHFKYHTWADILGGICAGLLIVVPFFYWLRYFKDKLLELALLCIMVSALILMILLPEVPHKFVSDWHDFGMLIGFLTFTLNINFKDIRTKVINVLFSLTVIALIEININIRGNPQLALLTGIMLTIIPLFLIPKAIFGIQNFLVKHDRKSK